MTAKETFESMAFDYSETDKFIHYENREYEHTYIISFDKKAQQVRIIYGGNDVWLTDHEVDVIHKQMKELGWEVS